MKQQKLPKGTNEVLGLTGMSLGMGIIGEGLGTETGTKLAQAGSTSAGFISPMVNISMGGMLINQLKGLKPKK